MSYTYHTPLAELVNSFLGEPEEFHHQGDESGDPIDFFTPVHTPEALHPNFQIVASEVGFFPARGIIEPMMRWHEDLDGNFVEQFQSTAFDQRIWELYLFATLVELGFVLESAYAVPDFIGQSLFGKIAIEAVTVGPTRQGAKIVPPPTLDTADDMTAYLQHYMPIKFGSPLFSKLRKNEQIAGVPLVFAVADFSSSGSMIHTSPALERYLYGYSYEATNYAKGKSIGKRTKITEYRWGNKVVHSCFLYSGRRTCKCCDLHYSRLDVKVQSDGDFGGLRRERCHDDTYPHMRGPRSGSNSPVGFRGVRER